MYLMTHRLFLLLLLDKEDVGSLDGSSRFVHGSLLKQRQKKKKKKKKNFNIYSKKFQHVNTFLDTYGDHKCLCLEILMLIPKPKF